MIKTDKPKTLRMLIRGLDRLIDAATSRHRADSEEYQDVAEMVLRRAELEARLKRCEGWEPDPTEQTPIPCLSLPSHDESSFSSCS